MKRFLLLTGLIISPVSYAALSPVETKLAQHVQQHSEQHVSTLQKLVDIQSGTMNQAGVKNVGEIVKTELDKLGFKTTWVYEPESMHRAPTLLAEFSGNGKSILLIGHLDTVFPKNIPFKRFVLNGDNAKGQGVLDDKGGVVVMLAALEALHDTHVLQNSNITIILTGDEESSGKPTSVSRQPLIRAAQQSKYAIGFEPAVTLNTITIARRGISTWKITAKGNASHSATVFKPGVGAGAIFNLSHCLEQIRTELQQEKSLSFNVGLIAGGSKVHVNSAQSSAQAIGKTNVVPAEAMAKGDLRYNSLVQKDRAKKQMRNIVTKHLPFTSAKIEFVDGIPPMVAKPASESLLNMYSDVSQDLGQGKVKAFDPDARGAADISYASGIVEASLSGLGPTGFGPHTKIERINLQSLTTQAQRAAILIYRLTLKNHQ